MQQPYDTVLCRSERGWFAGLPHGLAYAFTYRNMRLHLTEEEINLLKEHLDNLEETAWFRLPDRRFTFLATPGSGGCFYLEETEVEEIKDLLREASAMAKVHQRLLNRVR